MPRLLLCSMVALAALSVGCHLQKHVDRCATIPPGAIPEPAGAKLARIFGLQDMKAEADDFVIYQYEWDTTEKALDATGRRHLSVIARRLPDSPFMVVIETAEDPELDEQRRQNIVAALASKGVDNADSLVVVDYPEAEAMYGQVAPFINYGYLRSAAMMMGGGGGMGGGMGGMGMGMGGMGMGGFGAGT